jgi:signal transduction histidine kinase
MKHANLKTTDTMTAARSDCPKLLSLAVHELRTPVSVATGYLRMLLQFHGEALTDEQKKFVTEAAQSSEKLGDLLGDLSSLSRFLAGEVVLKREKVAIFSLAAGVAAAVEDGDLRGVRLQVRGADEPAIVEGDPTWLQAALRSLLAATVREQARAGTLVVECRVVAFGRDGRAVAAIGEEAAAAALASLSPNKWAPFDQWRGGLGFTLPIAAEVVAAHGGRLGSLTAATRRAAVGVALPLEG